MINRPGDGPEDVDAAFAEIIADLEREGIGRDVEQRRADTVQEEPEPPAAPPAPTPATASAWRGHETDFDWAGDDDPGGYEPPEPPPLPRLRPLTIIAIVLLVIGIVLLVLPNIIGLDPRIATPIALISLAGGIGFLLMRVRKTPPDFDGDDGAQV